MLYFRKSGCHYEKRLLGFRTVGIQTVNKLLPCPGLKKQVLEPEALNMDSLDLSKSVGL